MKKTGVILMIILAAMVPLAMAANLEVNEVDKGSVVIAEISNPAVFDLIINNKDRADNFEVYSLLGIPMSPKGTFDLPTGTSTITIKVYPTKEIRKVDGFYTFEYQLKGVYSGLYTDTLMIKIVPLKEAISVLPRNLLPGDKEEKIAIKNTENTNLEDVEIKLKSEFFEYSTTVSLKPYEQVEITVPVDVEGSKGLEAGQYIVTAEVSMSGAKTRIEGTLNYLEKEGTSIVEESSGILMRRKTITKTNEGNVAVNAKIQSSKDIVTRLFTVHSIEPTAVSRKGLIVNYEWDKSLKPADSFTVVTTTNYTFPFILIVLVIIASSMARLYYQTNVTLSKRVSYVKTKGGEFALKVTLRVHAKKAAENIQIIDRIPASTQIYEKFGTKPDKIDPSTRRLIWTIGRLNSGEERVYSYIIYSKLNIVGRFELPPATAVYEKDDKSHEVFSNKTFFSAETIVR